MPATLLIVDDEKDIRDMLSSCFRRRGPALYRDGVGVWVSMEKVKGRRLRDMGLRPTYVVYTLTAFVLATVLLFLLTRCLDSIRVGLYYEYKEMATVYPVPPGGDVDITWDAVSHVTILNSEGQIVENLSVDMSQNKLEQSFDTEEMTFQVVVTPVYSDTDRVLYVVAAALQLILVPACYGGAAILCAIWFYRRKLKEPLAILDAASARIAADQLDFTVSYDSRDEMGRLCASFEKMRSALFDNQRTTWRQMEERSRLNAAFSHDMRTPLTVLKGHAGMLLSALPEDNISREEVIEEVGTMAHHIDRLESYVEAMARLRRLEGLEVRRGPVDRGLFLAQLRDTAEIIRGKKDITWEVRGENTWYIDREVVAQVAENLLVNAFRHSRSAVQVRISAEEGTLCLVVSDDGHGFSRRALERATEPFYREEKGGRMGMGLYICRLLCERHGGSFSICNNAKGGGVACASSTM